MEMADWEGQLSDIIDKSSKNMQKVSSEYDERQTSRQHRGRTASYARAALYPSEDGNRIHDVVNEIDKLPSTCGPHQQAAINAFHATRGGTRPLSRGAPEPTSVDVCGIEARVKRSVDHMLKDKLTGTSRAIDALRDELSVLSDEMRQLTRNTSSADRRLDVLCHDVDLWRKQVGSDIGHIKEDVAAKASMADLKASLESTRLGYQMAIDAAVSPLQAQVKSGMRKMGESVQEQMQQISNNTQAFQRNLIETMQRAVKEETSLLEKKCIDVLEKKIGQQSKSQNEAYVKFISQIISETAVKIEANLAQRVKREVGKRKQDIELMLTKCVSKKCGESLAESLASHGSILENMKQEQKKILTKCRDFVTKEEAVAVADERGKEQVEQYIKAAKETDKVNEVRAKSQEKLIRDSLIQLENFVTKDQFEQSMNDAKEINQASKDRMRDFVTKEEAVAIAEDHRKKQIEQCMEACSTKEDANEINKSLNALYESLVSKMKEENDLISEALEEVLATTTSNNSEQFEKCKNLINEAIGGQLVAVDRIESQIDGLSSQVGNFLTKDEANSIASGGFEQYLKLIRDMDLSTDEKIKTQISSSLDSRINNIESSIGKKMSQLLNSVETTRLADRREIEQIIQNIDKRFESSQISSVDSINSRINNILESELANILNAVRLSKVSVYPCQEQGGSDNLTHNVGDFNCAVVRDACDDASKVQPLLQHPIREIHVTKTPQMSKMDKEISSPSSIVHLLGLKKSPSQESGQSAKSESRQSPIGGKEDQKHLIEKRNCLLSDIARTLSDVGAKRGNDSLNQLAADMRASQIGDLSKQSNDTPDVSINTKEALSLCGVHLDDSHESNSQSPRSIVETVRSGKSPNSASDASRSPPQKLEPLVRHQARKELGSSSTTTSKTVASWHPVFPVPVKAVDESGSLDSQEHLSYEGSMTSFDECLCVPSTKPSFQHNPTRALNPEPYEGWDVLLTELRASGRILKDSEKSVSSYNSSSF